MINYAKFINTLLDFSPRLGRNEQKTASFLIEYLTKSKNPYTIQRFSTVIPNIKTATLLVDGKSIPCLGTSFISGTITNNHHLISSLTSSQPFLTTPNINFNPQCQRISRANFYFAPSVAIAKADVPRILAAQSVKAHVSVSPYQYQSANILVGNNRNPTAIVIAHYDSIGPGATDNASGVAVIMDLIISSPESLCTTLYIFAGNEELSYDKPIYWGHGFRVFEQKFFKQLQKVKKIIVIDCVGNAPPHITQDSGISKLAFPIKILDQLAPKILNVYGSIDQLFNVYHSNLDTSGQISPKYLEQTKKMVYKLSTN